jgi:hypothetical protein
MQSMADEMWLERFGRQADKVREIARDIYDAKERLAIIAFVSDAEKIAAELAQGRRRRS